MKKVEFKISLKNIEPEVYRIIRVPMNITFHELHQIIQLIFPWKNKHLYKFETTNPKFDIISDREVLKEYEEFLMGNDEPQFEGFVKKEEIYKVEIKSSYSTKLEEVINTDTRINYIYDFGDNWEHEISVLKILELKKEDTNFDLEEVLDVKGICPPEDAGGVHGYSEIYESLFNKDAKGHKIISDWAFSNGFIDKEPTIDDLNKILNEIDFKNK